MDRERIAGYDDDIVACLAPALRTVRTRWKYAMTLTVNLPPTTIERMAAQAAASGTDVDTFVREAVESKLAFAGRSFREIMAPVHDDFRKSGMTDGQLDELVDEAVTEARVERSAKRKQQ